MTFSGIVMYHQFPLLAFHKESRLCLKSQNKILNIHREIHIVHTVHIVGQYGFLDVYSDIL